MRTILLLSRVGFLLYAISVFSCTITAHLHPAISRADWVAGREAPPWHTDLVDKAGTVRYRLTLQPLWYVEGGICAMEIMVTDPKHPDQNLLGERIFRVPQAFVITVEELEAGLETSRFGTVRRFLLPGASKQTLVVRILGSQLGGGGGGIASVPLIKSLTVAFEVTAR